LGQLINSRKYNKTGTGIGLSISKKLVESLGGKIKLKSEEMLGTIVIFTIKDVYQENRNLEESKMEQPENAANIIEL
jgi:signal transduction histidine kinase